MDHNPKWAIFVINLQRAPHRWRAVSQRLNALGLQYQRIDAVDGRQLSQQQLQQLIDHERARKDYHSPLSASEVGCYLSHLKAWQAIIEHDLDFAIVLEDDVVFSDNFAIVPPCIASIAEPWDVIKLAAPHKQQRTQVLGEFSSFRWVSYRKPPLGACAQAVSKQGATKMLAQRRQVFRPVDVDLQWQDELGLRIRGLTPYTVDHSHTHESDIFRIAGRHETLNRPFQRLKNKIKLQLDSMRARRNTHPQSR